MDKKEIVRALNTTSNLTGVVCIADITHDLGYQGRYIDDYLAVGVLAELIDKGVIELKLNETNDINDEQKLYYLKRLLQEE